MLQHPVLQAALQVDQVLKIIEITPEAGAKQHRYHNTNAINTANELKTDYIPQATRLRFYRQI